MNLRPNLRVFFLFSGLAFVVHFSVSAQSQRHTPTIDELLLVKTASSPKISPDGNHVAYIVTETDFKQDAFVSHIWLANTATGKTFQLTRGEKSCAQPDWSPNGEWLTFTSSRVGDKNQLFAIRYDGGEALQLTKSESGVNAYEWSPDGATIAYASADAPSQQNKDRKEQFGDYEVVRKDYNHVHIWLLSVAEAFKSPTTGTQRTKGKELSVTGGASWSPDGKRIAFSATTNPDIINNATADIYVLSVADTSANAVRQIVAQPGPDVNPMWSPDGKGLVFSSAMGNPKFYHANPRLATVSSEGGSPRSLTDAFDENPGLLAWKRDGIYFAALQKTNLHLFRLEPATGAIKRISAPDAFLAGGFSLSKDGSNVAFTLGSTVTMNEICVSPAAKFAPKALTAMTEQTRVFTLGARELVSWKSKDSTLIEGVLIKPADFDPKKRYPLLCVIHGGPTGIDRPVLLQPDARYYPSDIWAAKGALVLKVNYRGSAGYGEKFRQLNVRNLGVGDAWDVLSGVEWLVTKGWADPEKAGCMGWSQGGYISAFLTTHSAAFKAVSVGAGISNWATYYYNTDITPFTIQYLGDDPADDPEIYRKTSPMTAIKQAKTPTLIQHGENDRRVPIANAYELRQGLEDNKVPAELVVYKGFGHGITKPKSMRAVMQHNLSWFNHYLFGEPLQEASAPPLPAKDSKGKDGKKDEKKGSADSK